MSTKYNVMDAEGGILFTTTKKSRAVEQLELVGGYSLVTDKGTVILTAEPKTETSVELVTPVKTAKPKTPRKPKVEVEDGYRYCQRCKDIKLVEDFSPTATWCRSCINAYAKTLRDELKARDDEALAAARPVEKRCPRCDEWKSADEFYPLKASKDTLSAWCKDCLKAYSKTKRGSKPAVQLIKPAVTEEVIAA